MLVSCLRLWLAHRTDILTYYSVGTPPGAEGSVSSEIQVESRNWISLYANHRSSTGFPTYYIGQDTASQPNSILFLARHVYWNTHGPEDNEDRRGKKKVPTPPDST